MTDKKKIPIFLLSSAVWRRGALATPVAKAGGNRGSTSIPAGWPNPAKKISTVKKLKCPITTNYSFEPSLFCCRQYGAKQKPIFFLNCRQTFSSLRCFYFFGPPFWCVSTLKGAPLRFFLGNGCVFGGDPQKKSTEWLAKRKKEASIGLSHTLWPGFGHRALASKNRGILGRVANSRRGGQTPVRRVASNNALLVPKLGLDPSVGTQSSRRVASFCSSLRVSFLEEKDKKKILLFNLFRKRGGTQLGVVPRFGHPALASVWPPPWPNRGSSKNPPIFGRVAKAPRGQTGATYFEKNFYTSYTKLAEIKLITIGLASPERIRRWAEKTLPSGRIIGEVTNANTLHHKTLKPQKGGLFCERIFGPLKDFECACGKTQKPLSVINIPSTPLPLLPGLATGVAKPPLPNLSLNEITTNENFTSPPSPNTIVRGNSIRAFCSECDVEYTWSIIRRYQLGFIDLFAPVTHVWYLKATPSYLSILLDIKKKHLEQIIYCSETMTLENSFKFFSFSESSNKKLGDSSLTNVKPVEIENSLEFLSSSQKFSLPRAASFFFCYATPKKNFLKNPCVAKKKSYAFYFASLLDFSKRDATESQKPPGRNFFFFAMQPAGIEVKPRFQPAKKKVLPFFPPGFGHPALATRVAKAPPEETFSLLRKKENSPLYNSNNRRRKKAIARGEDFFFRHSNKSTLKKKMKELWLKSERDISLYILVNLDYIIKKKSIILASQKAWKIILEQSFSKVLSIFRSMQPFFPGFGHPAGIEVEPRFQPAGIEVLPRFPPAVFFKAKTPAAQSKATGSSRSNIRRRFNNLCFFSILPFCTYTPRNFFYPLLYTSTPRNFFYPLLYTSLKKPRANSLLWIRHLSKLKGGLALKKRGFFEPLWPRVQKRGFLEAKPAGIEVKPQFPPGRCFLSQSLFLRSQTSREARAGNSPRKRVQRLRTQDTNNEWQTSLVKKNKLLKDSQGKNLKNLFAISKKKFHKFLTNELNHMKLSDNSVFNNYLCFLRNSLFDSSNSDMTSTIGNFASKLSKINVKLGIELMSDFFARKIKEAGLWPPRRALATLPKILQKPPFLNRFLEGWPKPGGQTEEEAPKKEATYARIHKGRHLSIILLLKILGRIILHNKLFSFFTVPSSSGPFGLSRVRSVPDLRTRVGLCRSNQRSHGIKKLIVALVLTLKKQPQIFSLSFFVFSSFLRSNRGFGLKKNSRVAKPRKPPLCNNRRREKASYAEKENSYSKSQKKEKEGSSLGQPVPPRLWPHKSPFLKGFGLQKSVQKRGFLKDFWKGGQSPVGIEVKPQFQPAGIEVLPQFPPAGWPKPRRPLLKKVKTIIKIQPFGALHKRKPNGYSASFYLPKASNMDITPYYRIKKIRNNIYSLSHRYRWENTIDWQDFLEYISAPIQFNDKILEKYEFRLNAGLINGDCFPYLFSYAKTIRKVKQSTWPGDFLKKLFAGALASKIPIFEPGFGLQKSVQKRGFLKDFWKGGQTPAEKTFSFLRSKKVIIEEGKKQWQKQLTPQVKLSQEGVPSLAKQNKNQLFHPYGADITMNSYGASFIEKLLNELNLNLNLGSPEINQIDKQNRNLLYLLNKQIYNLKFTIENFKALNEQINLNPDAMKVFLRCLKNLERFRNKDNEISIKQAKKRIKDLVKQRDLLTRRTKLIRKLVISSKAGQSSSSMILSLLPVLPPDLRPIVKMGTSGTGSAKIAASDLNRLYQRVIYRNERLKKFNRYAHSLNFGLIQKDSDNLSFGFRLSKDSSKNEILTSPKSASVDTNFSTAFLRPNPGFFQKSQEDGYAGSSYSSSISISPAGYGGIELGNTPQIEIKFTQGLLQEAVDNLIQNNKSGVPAEKDSRGRPLKSLSDILKGKQGRFRQYLLGKRVDYSGRSVIIVGPKLKIYQCGIPKEMALELYLPFLLKRILNYNLARTVVGAKSLLNTNKPLVWELLSEIMQVCPVLLNRAPTLHRLGIQAFSPKLVDGRAILLHPLVCSAFNADFDGDQMAVHVPITIEARAEAWKLMLSRNNLLSSATGDPISVPSQDMVLGCYYLTSLSTKNRLKNKRGFGYSFKTEIEVLKLYNLKKIDLHANIWIESNGLMEDENLPEQTFEIRLNKNGIRHEINTKSQRSFDSIGKIINHYIKTTPGKVYFNDIIKNAINFSIA